MINLIIEPKIREGGRERSVVVEVDGRRLGLVWTKVFDGHVNLGRGRLSDFFALVSVRYNKAPHHILLLFGESDQVLGLI